ncbi:MAG: fibronectin type III domain-containing protein [Candidatus Altimarinota bacterium]
MKFRLSFLQPVVALGLLVAILSSAVMSQNGLSNFLFGSFFLFPGEEINDSFMSAPHPVAPVFEKNIGQYPDHSFFRVGKGANQVSFHSGEVRFEMQPDPELAHLETVVFSQRFLGARDEVTPRGQGLLPGKFNYLRGKNEQSFTDVPVFEAVRYDELYPGVDMEYLSVGSRLKYQYELEAGVSPEVIQAAYSARLISEDSSHTVALQIQDDGSLKVQSGGVTFFEGAPYTYQMIEGKKIERPSWFVLKGEGRYGFEVDGVDARYPLVIDPGVPYSTYLSGLGLLVEVDRDDSDFVYIAGMTASSLLAGAVGHNGNNDGYVLKMDPTQSGASSLVYATYIGTAINDGISDMEVIRSTGEVIAGGFTDGATAFPTTAGAYIENSDTTGNYRGFALRLNSAGNALSASTLIGGEATNSGESSVLGVAVSSTGRVAVTGGTNDISFRRTTGADNYGWTCSPPDIPSENPACAFTVGGRSYMYVMELNSGLSGLVSSGSIMNGVGIDVEYDEGDQLYALGKEGSLGYPKTISFSDDSLGVVLMTLSAGVASNGVQLAVNAFADENNFDYTGGHIAQRSPTSPWPDMDDFPSASGVVVAGNLNSNETGLVPTLGVYDDGSSGSNIGLYVMNGSTKTLATYVGESSSRILGVATDSSGTITVVGETENASFPVVNAFQGTKASAGLGDDGFVFQLNSAGTDAIYSTYFGGTGEDEIRDVVMFEDGVVAFSGSTASSDFEIIAGTAYDATYTITDGFFSTLSRTFVPGNLQVTDNLNGTITLDWDGIDGVGVDDEGEPVVDYVIQYNDYTVDNECTTEGDWVTYVDGVSTATNVIIGDPPLTEGDAYCFRVRGVGGSGGLVAGPFTAASAQEVLDPAPSSAQTVELHVIDMNYDGNDMVAGITDMDSGGANDYTPFSHTAAGNQSGARGYTNLLAMTQSTITLDTTINLTGASTLSLGDDELSGEINLPSPVVVYGVSNTKFAVSSNGFVVLDGGDGVIDAGSNGCCDGPIPIENQIIGSDDILIAGAWADLSPNVSGTISHGADGDDASLYVIAFDAVPTFNGNETVSFQIKLGEASGGPASEPGAVSDLAATSGQDTQVPLTWSAPASNGDPITDYIVEYGATSGFPGNAQVFSDGVSASTGATVTGLTNGTQYSFRVFAVNGIGTGLSSNVATATPQGVVASVQIHAIDLNYDGNTMTAGITDGVVGGGNDYTPFHLSSAGSVSGAREYTNALSMTESTIALDSTINLTAPTTLTLDDDERSYPATNLPFPVTIYGQVNTKFLVAANGFIILDGGDGDITDIDNVYSYCCDGTNPIETAEALFLLNDDILIAGAWSDLSPNNGGTISYGVDADDSNLFVIAFDSVPTFDGNETVSFQIKLGTPTAGASLPDAINNLNAIAGNTQVTLTWTAPADNGSAITDYIVEYGETSGFPGNAQVFSDGVSASTGATVTGLTNDTEYSFRVAAVNGVGTGPYSNVDSETPTAGGGPSYTSESEINIDVNDFLSFSIENIAGGDEPAGNQPFGAGAQITALVPSGANAYAVSGSFGSPVYTRLQTTTNSNDGYNVIAYASNTDGRTNTLLRTGGSATTEADEIEDTLQRVQGSQVAGNTLNTSTDTGIAFRLLDASTSSILRESDEDTQWGDGDAGTALWASFPLGSGAAQVIYDTLSYSASATTAYINWFVGISSSQQSGSYTGQITFTASVN